MGFTSRSVNLSWAPSFDTHHSPVLHYIIHTRSVSYLLFNLIYNTGFWSSLMIYRYLFLGMFLHSSITFQSVLIVIITHHFFFDEIRQLKTKINEKKFNISYFKGFFWRFKWRIMFIDCEIHFLRDNLNLSITLYCLIFLV